MGRDNGELIWIFAAMFGLGLCAGLLISNIIVWIGLSV